MKCPDCGHTGDENEFHEDGDELAICPECDAEFDGEE